jgi:hypothetical protein
MVRHPFFVMLSSLCSLPRRRKDQTCVKTSDDLAASLAARSNELCTIWYATAPANSGQGATGGLSGKKQKNKTR